MTDQSPGAPDAALPPSRYAVLRVRDFRLYVIARFVGSFAQQMLGLAVGWELFNRTHSPLALGFIGLTQIGPMLLLTLPAGHLADEYDRRNIVLWMTGATLLGNAGLTWVSWVQAPVGWTYVLLTVSGVARAFLWPASGAFFTADRTASPDRRRGEMEHELVPIVRRAWTVDRRFGDRRDGRRGDCLWV